MYKCENCGTVHSHINSYNDQYCYECIDIETGQLKKELTPESSPKDLDMEIIDHLKP